MAKKLDQFAKDIASGMSRRKAFGRFAGGMGAALMGLVMSRSARAEGNAICVEYCRAQGATGEAFGDCVSLSAHCPEGECAHVQSTSTPFCVHIG
jgi:hypothetical protein